MKSRIVLILILLIFSVQISKGQDILINENKIDEYVKPYLEMDAWSGIIAVYKEGKPLFEKAYGLANREWKIPNTIDTKFRIASISKIFTEVAILRLVETKEINLEDKLSKFIVDYPRGDEITVNQLLNHTSGIPNLNNFPNYNNLNKFSYELIEIIDLFKSKPLDFEPGQRYSYSNSGYVLLAFIIENISNLTYEKYLQKEIFDKIGLENTGADNDKKILDKRAQGYMFNANGELINAEYVNMSIKIGGGSLYSTLKDINTFLQNLLKNKLLTSTLSQLPNFGDNDGKRIFTASGRVQGFCHQLIHRIEDNITIIVLGNHYSNIALPISDDIYKIYNNQNYKIPENYLSQEVAIPIEKLQEYEGTYNFGFGPERKLKVVNGKLTYNFKGLDKAHSLIPIGNNEFFYPQYWVLLRFSSSENGNYKKLEWIMGENSYPAKRVGD